MTDLEFLQDSPQPVPARKRPSLLAIVMLSILALAALIFAVQLARQTRGPLETGAAPSFSVTTFGGQPISLEDLRGQVVILNFWASWCAPCREEAPALQAIWEQYGTRSVTVLGVAWSDIDRDSQAFIEEFNLTYPNAPDVGTRIGEDYLIRGVPETYIIDQNGVIVERLIGSSAVNVENLSAILSRLGVS